MHQVFKKVLCLTPTAQGQFTSGRIFNMVTSDAETLQQLCQNLLGVISSPARIIGAMVLLYIQLGPASLVALATLVVTMPIMVRPLLCDLNWLNLRMMHSGSQIGGMVKKDAMSSNDGTFARGLDKVKASET